MPPTSAGWTCAGSRPDGCPLCFSRPGAGRMLHANRGFPREQGASMPHIALNSAEPGIRGFLEYRPETARPLSELAEVLLRGPGTLTRGERELIAAYVSALNDCRYCSSSHGACAAAQL